MIEQNTTYPLRIWLIVFFVILFSTFTSTFLTVMPGMGPGSAAGWAAGAAGESFPLTAKYSPFFKLMTRLMGIVGPNLNLAQRLNILTISGYSLFTAISGLILLNLLVSWKMKWSPFLAAFGGIMLGLSRVGWASALILNPAPWSLVFLALACFSLQLVNFNHQEKQNRYLFLAFWFYGLALATSLYALLCLPVFLLLSSSNIRNLSAVQILKLIIFFLIPLSLYLLPGNVLYHPVKGLLIASPGISEATDIKLLVWTVIHTITPFGLLLALTGLGFLYLNRKKDFFAAILIIIPLLAGGFLNVEIVQYASILLSIILMFLALFALFNILSRFNPGYMIFIIFFVPVLWLYFGLLINRSDEVIWSIHARNVLRTVRYEAIVLCDDEEVVNTPYAFFRAAHRQRPDLIVINPRRLHDPLYLDWVNDVYQEMLLPVKYSFEELRSASIDKSISRDSLITLRNKFVTDLIDYGIEYSASLVSPNYFPPDTTYNVIPDGLLARIQKRNKPAPFHFVGLDLKPIYFKTEAPFLRQRIVAQYPMMFTARGTALLELEYIPEGMDYIRWALKIDPDYMPAKLVAKKYGIIGDPVYLGK